MAMKFTTREVESAELVLLIDSEGTYKWSSHRSREEVVHALRDIALYIETREGS